MQILQPSFKLLKTFLTDNPELTQKYVDNSVTAISHLLGPLNVFMRHLLVVQGLDPDSNPGERAARELQQAMSQAFTAHQKSYDDDYDFSWVQKRFDETRSHLKDLKLTKERYLDLTDLSKLPDDRDEGGDLTLSRVANTAPYEVGTSPQVTAAEVNNVAPVSPKREISVKSEDKNLIKELQSFINKAKEAEVHGDVVKFDPGDALKQLADLITRTDKIVEKHTKKKSKTTKKSSPKKIVKVGDHYALTESEKKPFDDRQHEKAELVKEMVAKGLCTPEGAPSQLVEMEKWNDTSLDALKRIIDKHQPNAVDSIKKILDKQVANAIDKHLKPEAVVTPKFKGVFRRVSSKRV